MFKSSISFIFKYKAFNTYIKIFTTNSWLSWIFFYIMILISLFVGQEPLLNFLGIICLLSREGYTNLQKRVRWLFWSVNISNTNHDNTLPFEKSMSSWIKVRIPYWYIRLILPRCILQTGLRQLNQHLSHS